MFSFLRAEGFFCSLDFLCGGLVIGKLQFLIKNNIFDFVFSCKFFSIFGHQNPGSGSVFSLKCWIRIKWMRIRNAAFENTKINSVLLFSRCVMRGGGERRGGGSGRAAGVPLLGGGGGGGAVRPRPHPLLDQNLAGTAWQRRHWQQHLLTRIQVSFVDCTLTKISVLWIWKD